MTRAQIDLPRDKIAKFCKRNHVQRLSLFGSVLRGDFRPDSDIDLLAEFDPEHIPGLIRRTHPAGWHGGRTDWNPGAQSRPANSRRSEPLFQAGGA